MPMIKAKARDLFDKIKNQQEFSDESRSQLKENFKAGESWFYGFKKRTGVVLQRTFNDQNATVSKKTFASIKD